MPVELHCIESKRDRQVCLGTEGNKPAYESSVIAGWSKSDDEYSGSRDLAKQGDARGSGTIAELKPIRC